MAIENTSIITTDIYKITEFINEIKSKYIDIPEDTLILGMYGYMSSLWSNIIENTATMASEYSNEAIPTKAKYERNVIAHALSLGINKINATPATMNVILGLPETTLLNNMKNNKFTLDKEFNYYIGEREQYIYHLDYDIIISRDKLPNGSYVYNARYDIDDNNPLAQLQNPYLPALGVINTSGENMVTLTTTLRQIKHDTIYKNIIVNNPLETMVITFSFESQLAYFYVEVVEDDVLHHLEPVYDGLYDYTSKNEFINYLYLDGKTIRLRFNKDSYQPRQNAEVTIHIYTTNGSECNFTLNGESIVLPMTSERFPYNGMYVLMQAAGDSEFGEDKLTVEQLKTLIPKEALSRGSISTYTDLNNFFNMIQTEDCKIYFLERVHNQIERLYFCYLLMKDGSNIIPTNTINVKFDRGMFNSISKYNFIMAPGSIFYHNLDDNSITGLYDIEEDEAKLKDKDGFLYVNPYLTVINKSPFYVSYYNVFVNYTRSLYFEFINEKSLLQFVSLNYYIHRDYFTDPNKYKVEITCTQNISSDFQLVTYNSAGAIETCNIDIYMVLYNIGTQGELSAYRYAKSKLTSFDEQSGTYYFEITFETNNVISQYDTYLNMTDGLFAIGSDKESSSSYISPNMYVKFFFLAKLDKEYGRNYGENLTESIDTLIPNLTGYTLTNVYNSGSDGIDIFYDYSDLQNSYITITPDESGDFTYLMYKMPVVRYIYLNSEDRVKKLFSLIDKRRRYIQASLLLLEDSFGIDYKFFNTYGKSIMYNINNLENIDRINLTLKFEIKFAMESDKVILSQIINSIKEYIEDINYITDLHIPNLITYITNTYRQQLVYIKFIGLNNYESLYQSIYKNPEITEDYFVETQTVPEFINVNTLDNDLPDIDITIVS